LSSLSISGGEIEISFGANVFGMKPHCDGRSGLLNKRSSGLCGRDGFGNDDGDSFSTDVVNGSTGEDSSIGLINKSFGDDDNLGIVDGVIKGSIVDDTLDLVIGSIDEDNESLDNIASLVFLYMLSEVTLSEKDLLMMFAP